MASLIEIEAFCTERLAAMLELEPAHITPVTSFASLGLDSSTAVHFVLELEDWLGIELYPAVTDDFPTVGALSAHLAGLTV